MLRNTNSAPISSGYGSQRLTIVLFGLMLTGSLCTEIKLPAVGVGLQNLLIPAAGAGILLLHQRTWPQVWERQRGLLLSLIVLSAWAIVASLLSPWPTTSLYYWLKYHGLGIGLLASFVLVANRDLVLPSLWVVLGFLVVLALLGVLEAFSPDSVVFLLFRSDASRSIYPRVASLMAWPNQFGVLMAIGVAITQLLGARDLLPRRWVTTLTLLFLTQVAQSGSRNAWLVLVFGLIWMAGRRQIVLARAAGLIGAFLVIVLVLPVSARQTGLWDEPSLVPSGFMLPEEQLHSTSLSPPGLSLSLRSRLWREAVAEIRERPISGLGLEAYQLEIGPRVMGRPGFNAHNLALNLAVEIGLVGLVLALVTGCQLLGARQPGTQVFEVALFIALASQILDCFLYDAAFMTLVFYFAAGLTSPAEDS